MKHWQVSLLFITLCLWQRCYSNQELNNEQCRDPLNPLFNQTIPWRIGLDSGANLYIPSNQSLVITDSTGCYTFQLYFFSYQSINAIAAYNDAWAILSGTLTDHCHGGASYSMYGRQHVDYPLTLVDSIAIQHATLVPTFILGTYTNGTYESDFTFTTERAEFYANRKVFAKQQRDEFRTFPHYPCTARIRSDWAGNYLNSQPFRAVLNWNLGPQLEFTFPADIPVTVYYFPTTNYYSQCPCDVYSLLPTNVASADITSLPANLTLPF